MIIEFGGLAPRRERINLDTGTGNGLDPLSRYAEFGDDVAVVRILHRRGSRSGQLSSQPRTMPASPRSSRRPQRGGREGEAEAGEGVEHAQRQAERGERADRDRQYRHVMDEIGRDAPIKPPRFQTAAKEQNGFMLPRRQVIECRVNPSLSDLVSAIADARSDMHVVASGLRRARHGRTIKNKEPVFRHRVR